MGIDIYMRWKGMTAGEEKAQITGFSVTSGCVGYLREAYHGSPYVTRFLVEEAFSSDASIDGVPIPAAVLRQRLPGAIRLAIQRGSAVYKEQLTENDPAVRAFIDFVELAERKEKEMGEAVCIIASY